MLSTAVATSALLLVFTMGQVVALAARQLNDLEYLEWSCRGVDHHLKQQMSSH